MIRLGAKHNLVKLLREKREGEKGVEGERGGGREKGEREREGGRAKKGERGEEGEKGSCSILELPGYHSGYPCPNPAVDLTFSALWNAVNKTFQSVYDWYLFNTQN